MIAKPTSFQRRLSCTALFACIFSAASALALPQVATPSFSPAGGVYTGAQSVAIASATSGATIVYTTDGSLPTVSAGAVTHGTIYSKAISVSDTTTLSAMAFENGYADSAVAISGYTLQAADLPAPNPEISTPFAINLSPEVTVPPTLNILYNFSPAGNGGINPYASLVQGTDGNFYGTTSFGFAGSAGGTVYKLTPAGIFTTLVSFTSATGQEPVAALVQGSDGNFYGTTVVGGSANDGTVFQVTPAGVLTTLASFTSANGIHPESALVQASDGNFYGTTHDGGSGSDGTVFQMTPAGVLTTLVSFTGTNGATPYAGLVQGSDGNFYGTTELGGSSNDGTVFKMTAAGTLTTLVSFNGTNGALPEGSLIQCSDGNFYGTTFGGGTVGDGTVFKTTPTGTLTTLISFNGTNGALPSKGVILGSDGNFYGTTIAGGSADDGTVFQMTPAGILTILVSFNGTNGQIPQAGLVQGNDGNFYGTTNSGGNSNDGVIFQLIVPATAAPAFSPAAGTYTKVQNVTITSATSGASIAYTTDGSAPTESNGVITHGIIYTGPITIGSTTTLSAFAFKSGLADSAVITLVYTIQIPSGGSSGGGSGGTSSGSPSSGGGGGAPSWWFLGFLAFAGILRWKLRKAQVL